MSTVRSTRWWCDEHLQGLRADPDTPLLAVILLMPEFVLNTDELVETVDEYDADPDKAFDDLAPVCCWLEETHPYVWADLIDSARRLAENTPNYDND